MADNYVVVTTAGNKTFRAIEGEGGILYPVHKNEAIGEVGDAAQYEIGGDATVIALLKGLIGHYSNQAGIGSPLFTEEGNSIAKLLHSTEYGQSISSVLASLYSTTGTQDDHGILYNGLDGYSASIVSLLKDLVVSTNGPNTNWNTGQMIEKIYDFLDNAGTMGGIGVFRDFQNQGVFVDGSAHSVFLDQNGNTIAALLHDIAVAAGTDPEWADDSSGYGVFKDDVSSVFKAYGFYSNTGDQRTGVGEFIRNMLMRLQVNGGGDGIFAGKSVFHDTDENSVFMNGGESIAAILREIADGGGGGGDMSGVIAALGDPGSTPSGVSLNELLFDPALGPIAQILGNLYTNTNDGGYGVFKSSDGQRSVFRDGDENSVSDLLRMISDNVANGILTKMVDSSNGYNSPDWLCGNALNGDTFNPFWTSNGATEVDGGNQQPWLRLLLHAMGSELDSISGMNLNDVVYDMSTMLSSSIGPISDAKNLNPDGDASVIANLKGLLHYMYNTGPGESWLKSINDSVQELVTIVNDVYDADNHCLKVSGI